MREIRRKNGRQSGVIGSGEKPGDWQRVSERGGEWRGTADGLCVCVCVCVRVRVRVRITFFICNSIEEQGEALK